MTRLVLTLDDHRILEYSLDGRSALLLAQWLVKEVGNTHILDMEIRETPERKREDKLEDYDRLEDYEPLSQFSREHLEEYARNPYT